jgi:hypothetical protein
VEGAFAYSEFTLAASRVQLAQAGAGGVVIGRFAWIRPDGIALNERASADDVLGFVLPDYAQPFVDWRRVFYDDVLQAWRIRQGLAVTLAAAGDYWARFPSGARIGDQVYSNLLDGSAISGNSVDGESSPWFVASAARAGQLAVISTWSKKV